MIKKRELHPLEGVLVGQAEDLVAMTGCTVVIVPDGAVCGVSVFGGSPCTRDTDALDPISNRTLTHAVVLTGGSCFGLSAVIGVETLLEERGIGRNVGVTVVPNISAAALFDLRCGSASRRPDAEMGRAAALNAFYGFPFVSGNHGAGTGATIGKTNALALSMKGGVGWGTAHIDSLRVNAVVAVNCVGDVTEQGRIIAGARNGNGGFADSERILASQYRSHGDFFSDNTILGCVMTNAILSKDQATRLAKIGQDALGEVIHPAHSVFDGDTLFVLATGKVEATQDAVGILVRRAVQEAILDGVRAAQTYGPYLTWRDLPQKNGKRC